MTRTPPAEKVLMANRGEIAVRVARTAARLGIRSVAVYSRDDENSPHWRLADEAVALEGTGAAAYLDIEAIIGAALSTGCDAVHPGYGFLSESASLVRRCSEAGLTFIGPSAEVLDLFGDKGAARRLAAEAGVPICRGTNGAVSLNDAEALFRSWGPGAKALVKAVAGGGGRGMRLIESADELPAAYASAGSEAKAAFGSGDVYLEEYIDFARHIEVQIIGDRAGALAHLYERECSLQRRHQKLIEFAPAPGLSEHMRDGLIAAAMDLARAAGVSTLCTFEFLVSPSGNFYFMEANPRLQVEHTVTEAVMGLDLVEIQFQLAAGASLQTLGLTQNSVNPPQGAAVQLRINMEKINQAGEPEPASGILRAFEPPNGLGIRLDTFVRAGYRPPQTFDSLLAKLIVHASSDGLASLLSAAYRALCEFRIDGIPTNIGFLQALIQHPDVRSGRMDTRFVERNAGDLAGSMHAHPKLYDDGAVPDSNETAAVFELPHAPEGCSWLVAPMGGTLVRRCVEAGAHVKSNAAIAVIESMKMEHSVLADASGRIVEFLVAANDSIQPGQPMALMEQGEHDEDGPQTPADGPSFVANEALERVRAAKRALLDEARPRAVDKMRSRGALTARERIEALCDPDSFLEFGGLAQSDQLPDAPADGLIMGSARIDGRSVMIWSQDFSVYGGSAGALTKAKILRAVTRCHTNGIPLVMLLDGGGHRIQEGQNSRYYAWGNPVFQELSYLSGWVPVVAVVLGMGYAANTNFCAMADQVIMVRGRSEMGLAGPALVNAGTGERYTGQQLGGARIQVDQHGIADLGVETESDALSAVRRFLSYLPSNASQSPPGTAAAHAGDQEHLNHLVPFNTRQSYDMRELIRGLADTDSLFEIKPTYGANLITAFARLDGRPVGFIANQPMVKSGMLDAAASEKGAHFVSLCDAYGLPLIYLIDVPGFAIGMEAERSALGRRSARLLFELGHATVPRVSVVIRKGYGLGYVAMCGGRAFDADACVAWPTAEICAMSIEGSVDVAYRKDYERSSDPGERRRELIAEIRSRVSALGAAEGFGIDDIIEPSETRSYLVEILEQAPPRRQSKMPPKFRAISPI